jgi:ribosomal protein L29
MSLTFSSTPTLRGFGHIAGQIAKAADGSARDRGADRRVRRGCIDETAPEAQPWDRNRFASTAERIATVESLVVVAKELQAEHSAEFRRGSKKQLEEDQQVLKAELDELMARPSVDRPVGRPATIRLALKEIAAALAKHAMGITRADVAVYEAIFNFLDFAGSGRWFPSWAKIARAANCCDKTVARALKRLKHHGLLAWVTRSTRNSPRIDPAREKRVQTSSAYFLDLKKRMAERVYQRFVQLRDRRHLRFGIPKAAAKPERAPQPAPSKDVAELRRTIAGFGASLLASDGHLG